MGLKLSGLSAWLAWLAIHIFFLIGFRNRVVVMLTWAYSYLTFRRAARLITDASPGLLALALSLPGRRKFDKGRAPLKTGTAVDRGLKEKL